jgi:AcrR family transcriptional regulator
MNNMKSRKTPVSKARRKKADAYHHGDLRTALIDAALEMLATQSPDTLSLRELAKRAGVSQAAPYRHFKDKETLLAAISEQAFELKIRYMTEAVAAAKGDPLETYFACGLSYFRMGMRHPQHFKLMFGDASRPGDDHPDLTRVACSTFALVSNMVRRCQKAGLMGPGDPYHKAMQCWAVVHGFTSLHVAGHLDWLGVGQKNAEEALRTLLAQHLAGERVGLEELGNRVRLFQTPESAEKRAAMELLAPTLPG